MKMSGSLTNVSPRKVGSFEVGPLAYGLWRFSDSNVASGQERIEAALEHGMNLIDVADIYGFDGAVGFGAVEERLGRVLASAPTLRDRMVLATKGGIMPPLPYDSSDVYLRKACEDSLRRLGVETIDLYQIHRPDMFTHPAEIASALVSLRDAGKIREVGVSNYTPAQVSALAAHLPFPIASHQPEFSVVHLAPLRDGTLDQCMEYGIAPLAWSPLGGGRIPRGIEVPEALLSTLDALAERESVDRAAVALAFVLAHPSNPVVIIGTQTVGRIEEATRATRVQLDRRDVYDLIQASEGVPLP